MPFPLQYLWQAGVPLSLFIVIVTALLYYWPRPAEVLLNRGTRQRVQIISVKELSPDTKRFRLSLGKREIILGLPTGKDIIIYAPNPAKCLSSGRWNGKEDPDEGKAEIERRYTPITGDDVPGYTDIVTKIYRPGKAKMADGTEVTWQDGGKMGLYLDEKQAGDYIDIDGPTGFITYLGNGLFKLPGKTITVQHVGMLAGGSGITPMLAIVRAAIQNKRDSCVFSLIYANKTESDILLRDELDDLVEESRGQFKVHYTLDFPPDNWKHRTGFISPEMIRSFLPSPAKKPVVLACGPSAMIDGVCRKNLEVLGYPQARILTF